MEEGIDLRRDTVDLADIAYGPPSSRALSVNEKVRDKMRTIWIDANEHKLKTFLKAAGIAPVFIATGLAGIAINAGLNSIASLKHLPDAWNVTKRYAGDFAAWRRQKRQAAEADARLDDLAHDMLRRRS